MNQNNNQIVAASDISKIYKKGKTDVLALDRVSFTVKEGEFLVIMGPSGSGKTSLLNFLAGFDTPTSGELIVEGLNLARLKESKLADWRVKNVGFIFQFYNLIPVLTAQENVELPLIRLHLSKNEKKERSAYVLDLVGLRNRNRHFPSELSGGEEQRVAIARAIVTDPKLIIADEPTGNLDRAAAVGVLTLMKELQKKLNKTIIMVTHDQEAAQYGERMIYLDKGKLINHPG